MSCFFLPCRTKSSSASVTAFPKDKRKAFQVRMWAGWLSTITPSISKMALVNIDRSQLAACFFLHFRAGETKDRTKFWPENGAVVGSQPYPPRAEGTDREGQKPHDAPTYQRGSFYRVMN